MSPTQPIAPEAPFHRAFTLLLNAGRDLLSRLQAAITLKDTTHLPRRFAKNPLTAEQRIARTLDWIVALARTLAGDRTWLITPTYIFPRFPARFPPFTAKLRAECGLPPIPPRTEAQKAAAHRRYVKKIFATQPVSRIAARLARRLNISQTADAWPTALCKITQTPAAYAAPTRTWAEPGRKPVTIPQPYKPPPQTGPP